MIGYPPPLMLYGDCYAPRENRTCLAVPQVRQCYGHPEMPSETQHSNYVHGIGVAKVSSRHNGTHDVRTRYAQR